MRPIARIAEADLTPELFITKYLSKQEPLIIMRSEGSRGDVKERILNHCGDERVDLMSTMVRRWLGEMSPALAGIFSVVMKKFGGTSLEEWKRARTDVEIKDFAKGASAEGPPLPTPGAIQRLLMPRLLSLLLSFTSSPPYLADLETGKVCAGAFETAESKPTSVEAAVGEWLAERERETGVYSAGDWAPVPVGGAGNPARRKGSSSPAASDRLFWGGPGASTYPLHRDELDADAFFEVWEGCKDFVMVDAREREKLARVDWPGFHIWHDDLFGGAPAGLERGWSGRVSAGETLYMPGELIHAARVGCVGTINLCRRPWPASAARDLGEELEEMRLEIGKEAVRQRSWIYRTIERGKELEQIWRFVRRGGIGL
ncbi:hypothetical protein TeGR_g9241 [Tetraparma gracilis]|uniref:JmjC domain-containing protein n=1 Tax=Tetraparma gracilis TaxID=2962635 RepID=A0ABQ6NC46_9STRA|nr:hypothetical protein TeGR_g9241 [Tetraparma gracilis]